MLEELHRIVEVIWIYEIKLGHGLEEKSVEKNN